MGDYYYNEKEGRYEQVNGKHKKNTESKKKSNRIIGLAIFSGVLVFGFVVLSVILVMKDEPASAKFETNSSLEEQKVEEDPAIDVDEDQLSQAVDELTDEDQSEVSDLNNSTIDLPSEEDQSAYLDVLSDRQSEIMDEIYVDDNRQDDAVFYSSKRSEEYLDENDETMMLYYYTDNEGLSDLSLVFVSYNDEKIYFDQVVVDIDGKEIAIDVPEVDLVIGGKRKGHCESYATWLRDNVKLENLITIPEAETVKIVYKNTDTDKSIEHEMIKEEKQALIDVLLAYQIESNTFIYDCTAMQLVLSDEDGSFSPEKFKVEKEEEQEAYLDLLEANKNAVMSKVHADFDEEDSTTYYYAKWLDRVYGTQMIIYFYTEDNGRKDIGSKDISDLSVYYILYSKAPIDFDQIIFDIDGEETIVDIEVDYRETEGTGKDRSENYDDWLDNNVGLENAVKIALAEKVIIVFKNTKTSRSVTHTLSTTEKNAVKDILIAYQLTTGEFIHEFPIEEEEGRKYTDDDDDRDIISS